MREVKGKEGYIQGRRRKAKVDMREVKATKDRCEGGGGRKGGKVDMIEVRQANL